MGFVRFVALSTTAAVIGGVVGIGIAELYVRYKYSRKA